jgi:hypothetical protein
MAVLSDGTTNRMLRPPTYEAGVLAIGVRCGWTTDRQFSGTFPKIKNVIRPLDMIWYDTFVNCSWFATRWQWYSTHLHTNNTQNNTINIKNNNKQNNTNNKFGRVLAVPILCEFYPGICLTTEGKARKTLSQGSRRDSKYTHYQDTNTLQNPHTHTHTNTHTLQNSLKLPQYKLKQTQYKIYPNEIDSQYNQVPSL